MKKTVKYFIELDENSSDDYWFRIMHINGQIIMTSEMYTRKATRTRIANNLSKASGFPVAISTGL